MTRMKLVSICVTASLFLLSSFAAAGVISQPANSDFLLVEGEDADSGFDEEGFVIVTVDDPQVSGFGTLVLPEDTNASGEAALYHQPGGIDSTATWKLEFATPGEYTLYYRYSLFEGDQLADGYGNEDSFFLALDFNQEPEQAGRSNLGTQGHNDPFEDPPYWEGQFHWQTATIENGRAATYTVRDVDVGSVLDFSIGTRERGSTLDLFLLHPNPRLIRELTEEEMDAMFLGGQELVELRAGDADQDLDFDQIDLVQVQVAAKYLTGAAATWGEGDWNGAPGGSPGDPPAGDGLFNQLDIVAAQQAGLYLSGPYAAIRANGTGADGQTSVLYNAGTGEMAVDAPAGMELTSINIDSATGIFSADAAANLGGSFDNDSDTNIFKATFGGSFGGISFGNVAQSGLSQEFVLSDLTVVGSLAGGGSLGQVDLIYVPEPSTLLMLLAGFIAMGVKRALVEWA